jgi:hypothetical protein
MDPIREGVLKFFDKTSFALQNAGQTFGFLPDGRELVQISEVATGLTVTFSDRADEGWPGFSLSIPPEASFSHATMGILTRTGFWDVPLAPKAVADHLANNNHGFPAPDRSSASGRSFSLNDDVEVKVAGSRQRGSFLVVKQTRDADSIEDAIRARSKAYEARWRETGK